jgi:hypothetical protein
MIKYLTRYLKTCSSEFFFIEAILYLRNDVKEARTYYTHMMSSSRRLSLGGMHQTCTESAQVEMESEVKREREGEKEERDRERERELKNALNERKPTLPCLILVKGLRLGSF